VDIELFEGDDATPHDYFGVMNIGSCEYPFTALKRMIQPASAWNAGMDDYLPSIVTISIGCWIAGAATRAASRRLSLCRVLVAD